MQEDLNLDYNSADPARNMADEPYSMESPVDGTATGEIPSDSTSLGQAPSDVATPDLTIEDPLAYDPTLLEPSPDTGGSFVDTPMGTFGLDSVIGLIPLIIIGAAVYYGARYIRSKRRERRLAPSGDTMRFALASAVLRGAGFRRRVIADDRHICRAKAPELGLDRALLVGACQYYERQNVAFGWAITVSLLAWPVAPAFIFLAIIIALAKQWHERFVLAQRYRKENFSLDAERGRFGVPADHDHGNLVCYGTTNPFVGLGDWIDSWSVPIDTTRRSPGRTEPPAKASVEEIYSTIGAALDRLAIIGMKTRDVIFVSGTEIGEFGQFLPDIHRCPLEIADPATIAQLKTASDYRARVYRWISVTDWDGDLVYSYLYRCERRGEALFFEATQLALAPVAGVYREIDDLPRANLRTALSWLVVALVKVPIVMITSLLAAYASVANVWNAIFDLEARRQRREVNDTPSYNYGAVKSERSSMAATNSYVFFQIIDRSLVAQILNHQVLKTLINYFQERGIDTSIIESQALTVINNSTFVNKGSIVSNSRVVGTIAGARSKIGTAQPAEKAA